MLKECMYDDIYKYTSKGFHRFINVSQVTSDSVVGTYYVEYGAALASKCSVRVRTLFARFRTEPRPV